MNNASHITIVSLNLLYLRYENEVDIEHQLPLGPLYVARALRDKGFNVRFLDYQFCSADDPFSMNSFIEFIGYDTSPVIGLSCMANLLPFAIEASKTLKGLFPEKKIIIGGVGTTGIDEKLLNRFPWVDVILRGEGELTAPELLSGLLENGNLSSVKGLTYREGQTVYRNIDRERILDLDSIPFPAYDLIDLNSYPAYGMMTSRGCPFPCTFCSVAPAWNRLSVRRSVDNVIEEVRYLNSLTDVDTFLFQDEFFVSTKPLMMEFCRALEKSKLHISWKCFGHVNLVDDEMMHAMADNGCTDLRFGIESGSNRILKIIKKGFDREKASDVVARALRIFNKVDTFFIWGFPFETMSDFSETLFQMIAFRLLGARVLPSLFSGLPATDIYIDMTDEQKDRLELCPYLVPEMVLTGHERIAGGMVTVAQEHQVFFELIRNNPDIFSGFYVSELDKLILPKLNHLQRHGFYHMANHYEKRKPLAQFRK